MNINEVYTAQSYIDQAVVDQKIASEDYAVQVAYLADDDSMVPMLIDGNHSLAAAIQTGNEPIIEVVDSPYGNMTLEQYVVAMGDLCNPERLDGSTLW